MQLFWTNIATLVREAEALRGVDWQARVEHVADGLARAHMYPSHAGGKMTVETLQVACTALRLRSRAAAEARGDHPDAAELTAVSLRDGDGTEKRLALYRRTHEHHPITRWAARSMRNIYFCAALARRLDAHRRDCGQRYGGRGAGGETVSTANTMTLLLALCPGGGMTVQWECTYGHAADYCPRAPRPAPDAPALGLSLPLPVAVDAQLDLLPGWRQLVDRARDAGCEASLYDPAAHLDDVSSVYAAYVAWKWLTLKREPRIETVPLAASRMIPAVRAHVLSLRPVPEWASGDNVMRRGEETDPPAPPAEAGRKRARPDSADDCAACAAWLEGAAAVAAERVTARCIDCA